MTLSKLSSENLPPNWISKEKVLRNPELWEFERALCSLDFWYFATRWVYTKDEVNKQSVRPFPQYDYLKDLNPIFDTEELLLVEKSRRMFMTWYCLARIVWRAMFMPNSLHMLQSKKEDDAKALKRKCEFIVKQLPAEVFFPDSPPEYMALSLQLPNGSEIVAIPQGEDQLRMYTVTTWFCDEGSKQERLDEALAGSKPSLEGGGVAWIISSTRPSYFHDLVDDMAGQCVDIEEGVKTNEDYSGFNEFDFETADVKSAVPSDAEDTGHKTEIRKGVVTWRNPGNGFFVVKLHYSADPRKDVETVEGRTWKAKAMRGMGGIAQWNQEYEIDATAMAESLVYNFKPDVHIVQAEIKDIPPTWPIFHTADVGMDAPTVGLWFVTTPKGDIIFVKEYYKRNRTIEENATAMNDIEMEDGLKPYVSKIDPSAFDRMFVGTTTAAEYVKYNRFYGPANNDLLPGIEVVKQYLKNAENNVSPGMYFLPTLVNTFKEFRNYRVGSNDKPRKGNDHAMDCIRYGCMLPPFFIELGGTEERTSTYRNKLTGYATDYAWPEEDYDGDAW